MLGEKTQAETIEEVIEIMDDIVDDTIIHPNRLGYFAALYRAVTVVVKERCEAADLFDDNDRMRRLDVVFANRYFDAYFAQREERACSESWKASFDNSILPHLLILQHLLLGMNAHIALDLGIAAAQTAKEFDGLTKSLEDDFMRLNNLLSGMIDTVQVEVGKLSPLLKYADFLAWRLDETFVAFSINIARDKAWEFAQTLYNLPEEEWDKAIKARDAKVGNFGRRIIGGTTILYAPFIWFVNLRESKDIRRNVSTMSSETWQGAIRNRLADVMAAAERRNLDLTKRSTQTVHILKDEDVVTQGKEMLTEYEGREG